MWLGTQPRCAFPMYNEPGAHGDSGGVRAGEGVQLHKAVPTQDSRPGAGTQGRGTLAWGRGSPTRGAGGPQHPKREWARGLLLGPLGPDPGPLWGASTQARLDTAHSFCTHLSLTGRGSCLTAGPGGPERHPREASPPGPSAPSPGPSISPRPQLPRGLLLLSSEMRRCEGYGGARDGLAGKMDEGAGGPAGASGGKGRPAGEEAVQRGAPVCEACVRESARAPMHTAACARVHTSGCGAWGPGFICVQVGWPVSVLTYMRGGGVSHHTEQSCVQVHAHVCAHTHTHTHTHQWPTGPWAGPLLGVQAEGEPGGLVGISQNHHPSLSLHPPPPPRPTVDPGTAWRGRSHTSLGGP